MLMSSAPPALHALIPFLLLTPIPLAVVSSLLAACQDGSSLQVCGEAEYADDTPLAAGALYAAYVTSAQPHAQLLRVDWQPALDTEGQQQGDHLLQQHLSRLELMLHITLASVFW